MKKSSLISRTTGNYQVNATRVTLVNAEKFLRNFFFRRDFHPRRFPRTWKSPYQRRDVAIG